MSLHFIQPTPLRAPPPFTDSATAPNGQCSGSAPRHELRPRRPTGSARAPPPATSSNHGAQRAVLGLRPPPRAPPTAPNGQCSCSAPATSSAHGAQRAVFGLRPPPRAPPTAPNGPCSGSAHAARWAAVWRGPERPGAADGHDAHSRGVEEPTSARAGEQRLRLTRGPGGSAGRGEGGASRRRLRPPRGSGATDESDGSGDGGRWAEGRLAAEGRAGVADPEAELDRERERETKVFLLLVHPPKWLLRPECCTDPKPGARCFLLVSHAVAVCRCAPQDSEAVTGGCSRRCALLPGMDLLGDMRCGSQPGPHCITTPVPGSEPRPARRETTSEPSPALPWASRSHPRRSLRTGSTGHGST